MSLWNIEQSLYEALDNKKYETIFTLANGYRGFRDYLEFSKEGQAGNFIAGVYDKASEDVTEIVNCPNPLGLAIYVDNERLDLDKHKVLEFNRVLDMQKGILKSKFVIELHDEKIIKIESERFVSRNNVHRWAAKYTFEPLNFEGKLYIENSIDGDTSNKANEIENKVKHYKVDELQDLKNGIAIKASIIDTSLKIIEITALEVDDNFNEFIKHRKFNINSLKVKERYEINLNNRQSYIFYKYGITYTERDTENNVFEVAEKDYISFLRKGYEKELMDHVNIWENIWKDIDIKIEGDNTAQRAIRFNLFQLSSSANRNDYKVSIPAKALHGEGYKGHIFWDTEIFMLPFFTYTQPETAKSLLMYRYKALEAAKENAREKNFKGAQYPWESADTGAEVTPKWGKNFDGSIIKIYTGEEEFHINSDIVYAIIQYYKASGDEGFLINYGLEIIIETTKFWNSRVEYNYEKDRYEINKVIGPDEFHEHINNNAYTNCLAKWSIKNTLKLVEWIRNKDKNIYEKLCRKTRITDKDIEKWIYIEEKIYIPKDKDGNLIEQFEGYFMLQDIMIKKHDINGMPKWPENVEIKDMFKTQLIKQADVIMLLFLLNEEFDYNTKKVNYDYYERRTMHKSSLSPAIYSIMGLKVGDTKNAYKYFMKTALTDLENNQGNTWEGLHAAAAGGVWQSLIFGFAGMSIEADGLVSFKPWLPEEWNSLNFNIKLHGNNINITIEKDRVFIKSDEERKIKVNNIIYTLRKNEILTAN